MMTADEIERVLRSVDVRVSTIEQILPTLATKHDLERFATKEDLGRFATKEDLERFATREDLERFVTKEDLKEELKRFPTREEMKREIADAVVMLRAEIEASRRHALVLHEDVKADIRMLAEHLATVIERLDRRP